MPADKDPEASSTEGGPIRLQLWLARAGVASRRQAERLIAEGRVSVNGAVVTEPGSKALLTDDVRLDGKALALETRLVYVLLNKPAGYISAMSDTEERRLAADLLDPAISERVYNVGRLDQWSRGLLLFTNDGELARRLGHPSCGVEKEYEVLADAPLPPGFFVEFTRGVLVEGVLYKAHRVDRVDARRARIILVEGKNREIRRVLAHYGRKALSLRRVRVGPLLLDDLPEGASRELSEKERFSLFAALGMDGQASST